MKSTTLDMGGIARADFIRYFLQIGETADQETFTGEYWKAQVGPEIFGMLGIMRIPRVTITISVDEDRFDDFLAEFRLRFLRAGG
jgi:hypothetical protein